MSIGEAKQANKSDTRTAGVGPVTGHTGLPPASWNTVTPSEAEAVGTAQASTQRAIESLTCFLGGSCGKAQRRVAPVCVKAGVPTAMTWPCVLADWKRTPFAKGSSTSTTVFGAVIVPVFRTDTVSLARPPGSTRLRLMSP